MCQSSAGIKSCQKCAGKASTKFINPLAMQEPILAERHITLPVDDRDCDACVAMVDREMSTMNCLVARERNIARSLQEALLPSIPSRVHDLNLAVRYKAALDESGIGGDFYDVFALEENTVALVMGDVCGKGLIAATQVAIIRHMLRYALYTRITLADAITDLNILISDHKLIGAFSTLFVGIYDADMRTVTYVSCGQEPALVVRNGKEPSVEILTTSGPVLGTFGSGEYNECDVMLFPGDAIALYTDGLSEAGANRSEQLQVSGLIRLLKESPHKASAEQLAQLLYDGAQTHAQTDFHDDVCVMVAKVDSH